MYRVLLYVEFRLVSGLIGLQLISNVHNPVTKIISQLPLFATYLVFTVHNIIPQYMFRLYGHPQVYHVYKNAKIIIKT
jgi:hypothetical protein